MRVRVRSARVTSARFTAAAAFRCGRSAASSSLHHSIAAELSLHVWCSILLRRILNRHTCSVSYLRHKRCDASSPARTRLGKLVLDEKMRLTSGQRTESVRATDASRPPDGPCSSAPRTRSVRSSDPAVRGTDPAVRTADPAHVAGAPRVLSGYSFYRPGLSVRLQGPKL